MAIFGDILGKSKVVTIVVIVFIALAVLSAFAPSMVDSVTTIQTPLP